jgi:hypothetical protein
MAKDHPWFYYEGSDDTLCLIHIPMPKVASSMITDNIPLTPEVKVWLQYTQDILAPIIVQAFKDRKDKHGS